MRSIPYRPEIDGLRAIAVLGVIFYHLDPKILPSGFVGVDIFFVISGYLITSIIWADNENGRFGLADFWRRRVRRILPAHCVMIILVLLGTLLLGLPHLINSGGKQAVAATACLSNYRMLTLTSDYWSPRSDLILLLHTWSLAVEEQFYLIFPVIAALSFRFLRGSATKTVIILIFLGSMAWCVWQTRRSPAEAFFLMPARAWELSAGALVAIYEPQLRAALGRLAPHVGSAGAALLLASLAIPLKIGFPWPQAVFPVLGTAMFLALSEANGLFGRILSSRPAVAVGKASYSLYLWHWPCLVIGGYLEMATEQPHVRPISLLVGIALGILSYHYVEPIGRRSSFIRVHAPAMLAGMAGLAFFTAYRVPDVPPGGFVAPVREVQSYDARFRPNIEGAALGLPSGVGRADVVLLGDSHALALASELDNLMRSKQLSGAIFASGGARVVDWKPTRYDLSPGQRRQFEANRDNFIATRSPKIVVLSARWETLDHPEALAAINRLIDRIFSLSPSSTLVIVGQHPLLRSGEIKMHEWLNWRTRLGVHDDSVPTLQNPALEDMNARLATIALSRDRTHFISVDKLFPSVNGRVSPFSGKVVLYHDDNHLSSAGAVRVVHLLEPLLEAR